MITPYITFHGNCHEAIAFYQEVFHCQQPRILPYGEYIPEGLETPPENLHNWVMHAEMTICDTNFWFADETAPIARGNLVRLTATVPNAVEAQRIFDALSADAKITLPPTETFYSAFHGALTDKFGVCWNIVAEEAPHKGS